MVEKIDNVTGEIICLVKVPVQYKTVNKKVLVEPATVKDVVIPSECTTVKVRKLLSPSRTKRISIPAKYQTVTHIIKVSEGKM